MQYYITKKWYRYSTASLVSLNNVSG